MKHLQNQKGQTVVEYILLLSLLVMIAAAVYGLTLPKASEDMGKINKVFKNMVKTGEISSADREDFKKIYDLKHN